MIQTICAMARMHWRTLILTLALLTLVNLVFLNDTLPGAFSTRQGEQSLTDSKTRFQGEGLEVVKDPLMLLGKGGIQELKGTQLDEAGIQEVELAETQSSNAGLPELEATRTSLVLKSTSMVVAALSTNLLRR